MRKLVITLALVLLIALLLVGIYRAERTTVEEVSAGPALRQANGGNYEPPQQTEGDEPTIHRESTDRDDHIRELIKKEETEYSTPILFYGRVVDEGSTPIADATIAYASVGGSFEGERQLKSDRGGNFSISGVQGKRLRILVTHPGYFDSNQTHHYFIYAGDAQGRNYTPNPARPEVFRLRKKGIAAELVHAKTIVRFSSGENERSFSLFDHSRRRGRPEYVIVRAIDNGRLNSARFRVPDFELTVPGGGLQRRTDLFQFTAPISGYHETIVLKPDAGEVVDLFVSFRSGNYGRFTFAPAGSREFDVESFLNPDSSPNLEWDESKQIRVIPTGRDGIDLLYPPVAPDDNPRRP